MSSGNPIKMKLPSKLRISCYDIDVVEMSSREGASRELYGVFSIDEAKIKIDTSNHKFKVLETFIHEILHGIYRGYRIESGHDEEQTVERMAVGLLQVLRDNPELLDLFEREL